MKLLKESKLKPESLLKKSEQLKKRAATIEKNFVISYEHWQLKPIYSKRALLISKIEKLHTKINKQLDEKRLTLYKNQDVWIHAVERKDLKAYGFYAIVLNSDKDQIVFASMEKDGKGKYLPPDEFNRRVNEMKQNIQEGKKDNLLEQSAEEVIYNITGMLR